MLPDAFPNNFNYQIRVILGYFPELVKFSDIKLYFPLAMLNSSLPTLLLLFSVPSRPFVLVVGSYLLQQEYLFRRGRASVVKGSFTPSWGMHIWMSNQPELAPPPGISPKWCGWMADGCCEYPPGWRTCMGDRMCVHEVKFEVTDLLFQNRWVTWVLRGALQQWIASISEYSW